MVPDAAVGVGGHARRLEYPAWACVAGLLCGLESDCGVFADLWRVVVGHALEEERGVPGVGRLHPVPYGVSVMGPRSTDGSAWYGGGPAPVCRPCLGYGVCGRLEGCGGVCSVECLEACGGVQHPPEVVRQTSV